MRRLARPASLALASVLLLSACADGDAAPSIAAASPVAQDIVVVAPSEGAQLLADAPEGLVVLDVRTPEEYARAHLPGAVNLDFYAPDFREQLAGLDPDVPYLLYCQSGNRSGQARAMMADLGFTTVTDVAGGIAAWEAAGLPLDG